jgi:hypothetical protein
LNGAKRLNGLNDLNPQAMGVAFFPSLLANFHPASAQSNVIDGSAA